ncbi:hypothetical protein [Clostridium sp.]|uniref:hypothetical protein n=1 Tax=Clostridium sp. TaxID=1506 RepID=UPI001A390FD6|nr:hypothetical protein [Clostridium sp.]MBK5237064.1 hypothetical protein [Clostridium sp.]
MKSKSLKMKILSGMLCTGLAFSTASPSFAAVKNSDSTNGAIATSMDSKVPIDKQNVKQARHEEMKDILQVVIKESISLDIISTDEGDKVLAYATAKYKKRSEDHKKDKKCKSGKCGVKKGGLFEDLVTDGILTKEKSDKLRENMHVKKTEIRTIELRKGLSTLIDKKVLTKEQSSKVEKAIMEKHAERFESYKKMNNMSEKERKAYMKENKGTKVSPMKVLIDNGTITKEQEIEIQKVLPHHNHGKK